MDAESIDELWNYSDPAGTEAKFRELLHETSEDTAFHAEIRTQIARTYSLRRQFDTAHEILNQVEGMLTDDMPRARIRYLLERGRTYNSAKQVDKASLLFMDAWTLAQNAGEDFYAVDAAHMLAIVETGTQALDWNLKAVAYAEASSQSRVKQWLGSLYNNIGWTYHDMGDYDSALDIFHKAEAWQAEHGKPDNHRIATWCIGRTLRSLGRIEEALELQQAQLRDYEKIGEKPGYTYEEIGECLLVLGRDDEASPYFAQAYEQLAKDSWLVANEAERLNRLIELGRITKDE